MAPFATTTSSFILSGLSNGAHTIRVRAFDDQGVVSAVASHAWTIDLAAPTETIAVTSVALQPSFDLALDNDFTRFTNAFANFHAGDLIQIQGTLDWSETNALAGWNASGAGSILLAQGLTFTGVFSSTGTLATKVTGTVTVDAAGRISEGAILNIDTGAFTPATNRSYRLIDNAASLIGHFESAEGVPLDDGDQISAGGRCFALYYFGGDGTDVTIVEASPPTVVFVSNTGFDGQSPGPTRDSSSMAIKAVPACRPPSSDSTPRPPSRAASPRQPSAEPSPSTAASIPNRPRSSAVAAC